MLVNQMYAEVLQLQVTNKFDPLLTSSQGEKGNMSQNPYEKRTHFSRSRIIPGNGSLADPAA